MTELIVFDSNVNFTATPEKPFEVVELRTPTNPSQAGSLEGKYKVSNAGIKVDGWIEENDFGEPVAVLDSIEVASKGKGTGRQEVAKFEEWAKSKGAKEVSIEAKRESIGFWKKLGYTITDQGGKVSSGTKELTDLYNKAQGKGLKKSISDRAIRKYGLTNVDESIGFITSDGEED